MPPSQIGYIIGSITGTVVVLVSLAYLFVFIYEKINKKQVKGRWLKVILIALVLFLLINLGRIK